MSSLERLTPSTNFTLWRLRVLPQLESKANKAQITVVELLPTVLDDTICIAYSQWLNTTKKQTLAEAVEFLEQWITTNQPSSTDHFLSRKWKHGESIECYLSELEALAASVHIKSGDRAFKAKFVEGLPQDIQPFIRLELKGNAWPSLSTLVEKVKLMGVRPTQSIFATEISEPVDTVCSTQKDIRPRNRQEQTAPPTRPQEHRRGPQCYNCSGYGHIARQCPSPLQRKVAGNDHQL